MMTNDIINSVFEMCGAALLSLNCHRLYRDKEIKGVSVMPVLFFTAWGVWNLYFYPALNCWWSFSGGVLLVVVNATWLVQLGYYSSIPHKVKGGGVPREQ